VAARKKRKREGPFEVLRALKDELRAKEERPAPKKPAPAPSKPVPPETHEDDTLLFHRLVAGTRPLDRTRGRLPNVPLEPSESLERAARRGHQGDDADAQAVQDRLRDLVDGGARFEVTDDGRRVEARRLDVPFDALRRLRRGLLPIDARLDLHGMRVDEARGKLEQFLRTMRSRAERCVLVIHGKGEHSPQGIGVLRGEIAAWLSQGQSSQHVAAFVTACERDGGEGALYVLLRR
jgi:DNA-nicking Smr family endonuclease